MFTYRILHASLDNNGFVNRNIHRVTSWHQVVVVNNLNKRLDLRPLCDCFRGHSLCHLERLTLDTGNKGVSVRPLGVPVKPFKFKRASRKRHPSVRKLKAIWGGEGREAREGFLHAQCNTWLVYLYTKKRAGECTRTLHMYRYRCKYTYVRKRRTHPSSNCLTMIAFLPAYRPERIMTAFFSLRNLPIVFAAIG